MQAITPLCSVNKPAHQHEPWKKILSNFPEKTLTPNQEKEKNKTKPLEKLGR